MICPIDGSVLVVVQRVVMESTDGPVEHVGGWCAGPMRHPFFGSVSDLETLGRMV